MTLLKRLRVLTALLGVAGGAAAVGTTLFGDVRGGPGKPPATTTDARPDGNRIIDELAVTRFSQLPAITYQVRSGETLFAWQVKPTLDAAPARPRDVLVLVDTSASQAGKPLQQARQIITGLSNTLTSDDRISVWTVSTPAATRSLSRDFQSPTSEDIKTAAAALTEVEYGSGATDLKGGFAKALATMAANRGRQQVVLFLGDGDSAYDPMSEDDRVAIGNQMDASNVAFFAVPLGVKVNPSTLHGLASLTGGTVVRIQEDLANPTRRDEFVARLKTALDVPVLKADKFKFGDEVAEFYPTKLPPLRADKPTLVMGKLAKPAKQVTMALSGKATGGKAVSLALAQDLPATQPDHFFLNMMIEQWRDAPHKDAPAMLQADRALALASTQVKLYRDEFLTQANWAVTMDRLDEAQKLFTAAKRIDPNDGEANAGVALVEKMKTGRITKAELEKKISAAKDGLKIDSKGATAHVIKEFAAQDKQPDPKEAQPAPGVQPAQPGAPIDRIREAEALRRIEEQRYRTLVDATIRRSRQLLRTDPDQAYLDLKRQRDEILAYGGISDEVRSRLSSDITSVMDEIFRKGAEIKRQAAVEREQIARTRYRLNEFDRQQAEEERTKARLDAFKQLMQQARFELAYQEAQILIQERISKGQSVPSTAVASYIIGQQATQLREWRELSRIREDRFLLAMMQTEKSHIPYPDEPPVHFPPAAVWRELTGARKERYENSILGPEASPTQKKIQSVLDNQRVSYEKDLQTTPFKEVIEDLAKRYDIIFVVNKPAIGDMAATLDTAKAEKLSVTKLDGMPIGNFLDVYLRALPVPYITYIARPDYIEITSYDARLEEKVTRVFPVADLVIPIPQAVNQMTLYQNLGVQQQTLAIFGAASLYGGNLSGFLGGNQNNQQGLAPPGGGAGQGGNPFFGQFGNQGNQGGIVGLGGGGGIGQFGNLGGQFGLQGGTQEGVLIRLILETVAKGEWDQSPQAPPMNPNDPPPEPILPPTQRHSIGYYPPARALVVRGTSRYMGAGTMKLKKAEGGQANLIPNDPNKGVLVIGPNSKPSNPANPNANPMRDPVAVKNPPKPLEPLVINGKKPTITDPKLDPEAILARLSKDPKRKWHEAIDWTVTDPGLIVAVADFLMDFDEFGHAAEVLKANLRKGLATDEWAHEALAVALQMSKADAVEVERAALSAIDLEPTNPKSWLKAAKVEAELKNNDQAVAFCKKAAEYGPDQPGPYANALAYAKDAKNVSPDTIAWAATNLLQRDWAVSDGIDYQRKTRDMLPQFAHKFQAAGIKADVLNKALVEETRRDLVIELLWQGAADLDLSVIEPSGSTCSATMKRTTGGGVLKGDIIEQTDDGRAEVYTAASAFTGTYKVNVRSAFGRAVGNTATIKVTRFKGTPKESHDLITVDLARPQPVEIKLDGGSRTELATVTQDVTQVRLETAAPQGVATPTGIGSGLGGGCGTAGSVMSAPVAGSKPALPVVAAPQERVLPGMGSAADIRASYKLNADRTSYSVHVNPVFSGGKDVKLPKVDLIPGSEK
jgi:tetratricopeptide (TPR) repeat protein